MCWEIARQSHFPASDDSEVDGQPHKESFSSGLSGSTTLHWPNSPMDKEGQCYWPTGKSTFSFQDSGELLLALFSNGLEMTEEQK